jgi:hypothetical protein
MITVAEGVPDGECEFLVTVKVVVRDGKVSLAQSDRVSYTLHHDGGYALVINHPVVGPEQLPPQVSLKMIREAGHTPVE